MPINWNVNILAQPSTPSNWLVAALYDATAPNVVVDYIVLPKPYGDSKEITFIGLEFIVYDFKLFESATETPVGAVLNSFSFQPAQGTITVIREDMVLKGGITPGFDVGGTSYEDDTLIGWWYDIERRGAGTLIKDEDYQLVLDGTPEASVASNGWELLVDGDVIGDQEIFILHFHPQVTSGNTGGGSGGGNLITGAVILSANIALDNSYMKKACLLQGASTHFTVTLPPLNTVGENQQIWFISDGGTHINATIDGDGSDNIRYNGLKAELDIAQGEKLCLFKADGVWNVLTADGNFKTVGQIVESYFTMEPNCAFANGALLSRTDYARLWKRIQSIAVSDALWNTTTTVNGIVRYINRGKFTTGDGSTTFRVPMIYAVGNLKAVDGSTRLAGSFEADQVGQFSASLIIPQGNSYTGGGGADRTGRGSASPNNMSITPQTFNTGLETKEANFGIYALIRY